MSEIQFHQLTEQIEALSWKMDQLFNEVDSQVSKIHKRLAATLEIHERLAALEALTDYQLAARPEPLNLESLRR